MALPKINHPIFELTLPSTKQTIQYRPFVVREEKILLVAQASQEPKDMINAIRQVVTNCIVTEGVDVNEFASFDLEYFFLKLRSKSVGNIVQLTYRDNEDEQLYTFDVDLDSINIVDQPNHTNTIDVPDGYKLTLRYPNSKLLDVAMSAEDEGTLLYSMVKLCANTLYRDSEVYNFADQTEEEIDEFVSSLPVKCFEDMKAFLYTIPRIRHEIRYTNQLGNERAITLQNLNDFFTLR